MGHPKVHEAAVVGLPHPKWDERPMLVVVLKPGQSATKEELLNFLSTKISKWWLPNDVHFVKELPHGATGKVLKKDIREMFKNYQFPDAKL
jgi:fatty-acyl-CoA synthase